MADPGELWPPAFGAWIKVAVCYQKGSRHLGSRLRPLGLTVAQFDALANLYVEDGISQQVLAVRLLVTKGNVTGLVNRLADQGMVERRSDPADRRTNRIVLTPRGRALAKEALEVQGVVIKDMMGALSQAELRELRTLLARVDAELDTVNRRRAGDVE